MLFAHLTLVGLGLSLSWALASLPFALGAGLLGLPLIIGFRAPVGWQISGSVAVGGLLGPVVIYGCAVRAVLAGVWKGNPLVKPGPLEVLAALVSGTAMLGYLLILREWHARHPRQLT